jgi:hypothetical protein
MPAPPLVPCVKDIIAAPSVHTTTAFFTRWIGHPTFFTSQLGAQDHVQQRARNIFDRGLFDLEGFQDFQSVYINT